jgi:hypothetical protein
VKTKKMIEREREVLKLDRLRAKQEEEEEERLSHANDIDEEEGGDDYYTSGQEEGEEERFDRRGLSYAKDRDSDSEDTGEGDDAMHVDALPPAFARDPSGLLLDADPPLIKFRRKTLLQSDTLPIPPERAPGLALRVMDGRPLPSSLNPFVDGRHLLADHKHWVKSPRQWTELYQRRQYVKPVLSSQNYGWEAELSPRAGQARLANR